MPWEITNTRRYYLRAAVSHAVEQKEDLTQEILRLRVEQAQTPIPAKCPSRKKLLACISAEIEDATGNQVLLYESLEDLQGADEEELTDAGLTEEEAAKVVEFIEAL